MNLNLIETDDFMNPSLRESFDSRHQLAVSKACTAQPKNLDAMMSEVTNGVQQTSKLAVRSHAAIMHGDKMPLPSVFPQTTKSFRGAFFSPFVRAYVPELALHGIDLDTFMAFLDGLNEAFVANPVFQYAGIAGAVMTQFYGVHPVQWAGMGLQLSSGAASAAMSYFRTKAYVKATNADLFHPAGLHLNVMTTKKMMEKVHYPEDKLPLPPLEMFDDLSEAALANPKLTAKTAHANNPQNDARMRRIQALHGYVMPLDFNVPAAPSPDNLLRKMGASQATRLANKQDKKMAKNREKAHKEYLKKMGEAHKKWKEGTKEVEKIERKISKEEAKVARRSEKDPEKALRKFQKEETKLLQELKKEEAKREEDVGKEVRDSQRERRKIEGKEEKIANKIRWLVISEWEGEEEDSQSGTDGAEDDAPPVYTEM